MNPSHAYKQQQTLGWSRIDMLLALYGGTISRLEQGLEALKKGQPDLAKHSMLRAQRMVIELLAGVDLKYGELPARLVSLYDFVLWSIDQGTVTHIQAAISVLNSIREGMEMIREEALNLERSGQVPPAGSVALSQAV